MALAYTHPRTNSPVDKGPKPSDDWRLWQARIDASKRARELQEREWERYRRYYKNEFYVDTGSTDRITVNQVFTLCNIYESVCCAKNPYIYVKPLREEFAIAALINESLLNYYWRELDIKKTVRRCVRDAILCSAGHVDLGYASVFKTQEVVRREGPYVQRISPWNIWFDPDAEYPGDETEYYRVVREIWPFHIFKKRYPDAAKYVNVYRPKWPLKEQSKMLPGPTYVSRDDPLARVSIYRIQDLENNEFLWMCDGYTDFLEKERKNPYDVEGFLTESLIFHEIPEEVYGMSVIRPAEGQQIELNKIRTSWMNHRKRFNRRYIAGASAFAQGTDGENQRELLKRGEDGSICDVQDINQVIPLADASMPPDVGEHEARIKEDWKDITVVNEYLRAGAVPRTKTAYETSEIVAGTKLRLGTLIDDVRTFDGKIAKKLLQIMQQHLKEPIVVQIIGPKGQFWGRYTRKQIQGEMECIIYPGEMLPPDEERSRLLAERFYKTFRPDPACDQRKVLRKALEMWGIPDPDGFLVQNQGINPLEVQGAGRQSGGTASGILKALKGGLTPNEGV